MVNERYSHLNNRLTNWLNGTVSRPIYLNKENKRCSQCDRALDNPFITSLRVLSVGNNEGTLTQTDIHLLRQIYSQLYDIKCLINDAYGNPILANMCCMLTGVVLSLYEVLIYFNEWGGENKTYVITFVVLFLKLTLFCHTATNDAKSSSILVQMLLLERNYSNEYVKSSKCFFFNCRK